jgi:ADP-ribosyl-[dinitrogen reductase] hydrolase
VTTALDLRERLAGAVWGHLVADAMGVPYEFAPPTAITSVQWGHAGTHGQPPGTWSDDGGLMLALLDSLLSVGFEVADQGRRALAWRDGPDYKPGNRFDIGPTTRKALSALADGTPAEIAGGHREHDNGNGSLMRILPVALVGRDSGPVMLVRQSMQASSLTHRHATAQLTCALYVLIAQQLLRGQTDLEVALASAHQTLASTIDETMRVELSKIMAFDQRTGSGYVVDTFWSAWDALRGAVDYRDAVVRAIRFGNDTDTTACVAGGLAGIIWGVGEIPPEWLRSMRGQAIVEPLVARLVGADLADQ